MVVLSDPYSLRSRELRTDMYLFEVFGAGACELMASPDIITGVASENIISDYNVMFGFHALSSVPLLSRYLTALRHIQEWMVFRYVACSMSLVN